MESEKEHRKSYEGIALYVFCETQDDVKKARILARNNPSSYIIVDTIEEIKIYDDVFSLKAAFGIDKNEFSVQDIGILKEQIRFYDASLYGKLKQDITSKNLTYYGKKGIELTNGAIDDDAAAVKMLESIYESKRNKINHEDINKSHIFKEGGNAALREAIEILLDLNEPVYFRKDYGADRGDIKYIQNVLLNTGVIKQVQTVGYKVICELEQDTAKYEKVWPALAAMLKELRSFNTAIRPQGLIDDYMKTYGIGYNAAMLFFAVAKRFYKDSLIIIPEAHDIGVLKVTSYDTLLDLLYYKKYKNAVMEYKQIHEHDAFFIKEMYKLLTNKSITSETSVTIDQLHERLIAWYKGLDNICKVEDIYKGNDLNHFIGVFNKIDRVNMRDFTLEEIKTIYGYDRQDLILTDAVPQLVSKFKKDKERIEQGYYIVRERIFTEIKDIFNASKSTVEAINAAINLWVNNLTEEQRSFNNELQNDDSKPLVMHLGKTANIEEIFMEILPGSYNLGAVKTWKVNKIDSLIQKIKAGKIHIEGLFSINPPKFELNGKDVIVTPINDNKLRVNYIGVLKLKIIPDIIHKKIFITSNDQDPKNSNAQREEKTDVFTYETTDDKCIRFCGVDNEGNFSKVVTLQFVNEDNKFEVKYVQNPKQLMIGVKETSEDDLEIQVTLPKDEESLTKCFKSIIKQSKIRYNLKDCNFVKVLKTLLDEFKE